MPSRVLRRLDAPLMPYMQSGNETRALTCYAQSPEVELHTVQHNEAALLLHVPLPLREVIKVPGLGPSSDLPHFTDADCTEKKEEMLGFRLYIQFTDVFTNVYDSPIPLGQADFSSLYL